MYRQVGTDTEVSTTCKVALGRAMDSDTLVGVPILFTLYFRTKPTTAVRQRRSLISSGGHMSVRLLNGTPFTLATGTQFNAERARHVTNHIASTRLDYEKAPRFDAPP